MDEIAASSALVHKGDCGDCFFQQGPPGANLFAPAQKRGNCNGVTYQEDKPLVTSALQKLAGEGLYPTPLWE